MTAFNGLIVRRVVGLLIRCLLTFNSKPSVLQPDDNCDANVYGEERTTSNPQAVLRKQSRAAGRCD